MPFHVYQDVLAHSFKSKARYLPQQFIADIYFQFPPHAGEEAFDALSLQPMRLQPLA
jgi:hypothetical protein